MDLLFSYKGGDKNMDNVLLYFSLKHEGDFKKIYESLKAKEPVDENEFIKLKRVLKTKYVTILDSNYPDFLKQVSCPPFVLFYEGNLKLAKNLKVGDDCRLVLENLSGDICHYLQSGTVCIWSGICGILSLL